MQPELVALLAVQEDDKAIRAIENEMAGLEPRAESLRRARQRAADELEKAIQSADKEKERYHELGRRINDHREKHERNLAALDQARKLREATAAMAQVEMARKVLAEEESELASISRRINELNSAKDAHALALEALDQEQEPERKRLEEARGEFLEKLAQARKERDTRAAAIGPSLLSRYERISSRRRNNAVYAIRGLTCGACDTAIPLQRRNALIVAGQIDVCEACGVMLYAAPATPAAAEDVES